MGRPFEIASSPGDAEETESSSGEEQSGDEGLDWVASGQGDDDGDWQDPSGGVLSQVFDAAEAGDAAALTELLHELQVSIDTRVSAPAFFLRSGGRLAMYTAHQRAVSPPLPDSSPIAFAAGRRQRHRHPFGGAVRPC